MTAMVCLVYKSLKKDGMYLYVEKSQQLKKVPEALLSIFGQHKESLTLLLAGDKLQKPMAGVTGQQVLEAIIDKGFYLQMPPVEDDEMRALAEKNTKL